MRDKKVDFSMVLACYNEGPTFRKSVDRIIKELDNLDKIKWEIVFVEDKSTDNTKSSIAQIVNGNKKIRAVYHTRNEGRGKSVGDGIKAAKGEICGYLDVDCEVSPSYIPLFINEIAKGYDLVVGRRFYETGLNSLVRVVVSGVYSALVKLVLGLPIDDTEAGFKFFRKSKILAILSKVSSKHWFWDTEICAQSYWQDLRISQIPVLFIRRPEKKSTVKLFADSFDYLINLYRLRARIPKRFR